ncbi:McrC family protein [Acinetobacter towneri]|uniref:McrC family protein n=1 Tax=Acinetobacter towneri TaxID=202956 RepID=UPI0029356A6B|nr:McrC family protein [Acinetobacter towneri]MDV2485783.1 McrC family protein [Acinetobacter towneri]
MREYGTVVEGNCFDQRGLDEIQVPTLVFQELVDLSLQFKKNGVSILHLETQRRLKVDNYVGIIQTKCGNVIEILPKHVEDNLDQEAILENERALLKKMLLALWNLPKPREAGQASLQTFPMPLNEWLMQYFLEHCEQLIQRGLRSEYSTIEEQSSFLKGKLDVTKMMRQPVTKQHLLPIHYDEFLPNTAPNRLLKSALEKICKLTQNNDNWRLAIELKERMSGIPQSAIYRLDFQQWHTGRLLAHYDAIKPWCQIILGDEIPLALTGDTEGFSFLFRMEKLFEAYVFRKLQAQYSKDYRIQRHKKNKYLCHHNGKNRFNLRPDIYFEAKNKNIHSNMILDTKWKLLDQNSEDQRYGISDGDMQQMFAYSYMYLEHDGPIVLIYPKSSKFNRALPEFRLNKHEIDQGKNPEILVLPFDLDNDELIGFDMKKLSH